MQRKTSPARVRYKAQPNAHGVYYCVLKDGSKQFYVRHPTNAAGQRLYERVGTRLDAAKARANAIRAQDAVAPLSVGTTFAEVAADWRATRRTMTSSSTARFDSVLRLHIEPHFNRRKIREITPGMIQAWLNGLKRLDGRPGELSDGSKRLVLSVLDLVLRHAAETGVIAAAPKLPRHRKPKPGAPRKRVLTPDEERTLLAYCGPNPWLRSIITVTLHQALRLGEVVALRWEDVDFAAGKLHVRQALHRDGTFGLPKGGKPATIQLTPLARAALLELRQESGLVFRNGRGNKRSTREIQMAFSKAVHRAALRTTDDGKVVLHSLRHTGISRLANHPGIPLVQVQRFARHANLVTTMGYMHPIEDEAVNNAIAEALAGTEAA